MISFRWIVGVLATAALCRSIVAPSAHGGPPIAPTLAQALDTTNLTWVTGGGASWFGQNTTTHDGVDAARSGAINAGQFTYLQTTVQGPGTLTFWWKVFTENFGTFDFYIGGEYQTSIYADTDWDFQTWEIPAGPQTLRWEFSKSEGTSLSADTAWLDQVSYTRPPLPPPVKFLSLTNSGANFQLTFSTQSNWTHAVEYRNDLQTGAWLAATNFVGTGGVTNIVQPSGGLPRRFYQVLTY